MSVMFIDTSGLFAFLHIQEHSHSQAVARMNSAGRLVTHSYVLAEFIALCTARRVPRQAAVAFAMELIDNSEIVIVWVNETLHRAALSFLNQRLDKSYSLCDAVSFLIMREQRLIEALTTDRHFEQEGFLRLLEA